ncbi:MAG TPA: acetyltransferase [Rhodospirillales bacterium]|nr:acetyltransferase [Rhodospirillales bacterium]
MDNIASIAMVSMDGDMCDLVDSIAGMELFGIFEMQADAVPPGLTFLGNDKEWPEVRERFPEIKVILAIDTPNLRRELFSFYGEENITSIIAPDAIIALTAQLGPGCIIQHGVKIMRSGNVGTGCKFNLDVTVHHDAIIGDFCTLAPGCRLLGNVTLEDGVYIGSDATILPRRRIARGTVVGAGAVVSRDTIPGEVVVGIPARPLNA